MNALKNKVAIVTGAGRGIGKAIAKAYANEGAIVYCLARSKDEIDQTVIEIEDDGGNACSYSCDITELAKLETIMERIYNQHETIDLLVVNAGIDKDLSFVEKSSVADWHQIMEVNLTGAFYSSRSVIPYMKESEGGKIIVVGSELGHESMAKKAAYCCSKAGVWMLTRVLAEELYEHSISVNELIPGRVKTTIGFDKDQPMDFGLTDPYAWIKEPEEVVDMALFLAKQPDIGPTGQSFSIMRRPLRS